MLFPYDIRSILLLAHQRVVFFREKGKPCFFLTFNNIATVIVIICHAFAEYFIEIPQVVE